MANCPACGRAVALSRAHCLYCGAPLGGAAASAATPQPAAPEPGTRDLVLVDLSRSEPETLAPALAFSRYEAGLLTRRGGLHLVRAATPEEAAAEAERLRSLAAQPILVPEAEVRAAPVPCLEGEREGDGLRLRSAQGSLTLAPDRPAHDQEHVSRREGQGSLRAAQPQAVALALALEARLGRGAHLGLRH